MSVSVTDPVGPEPVEGHPTPGTHIWGWMRVPELEWLYLQAKRAKSIVEIGSLHGRSAFALLSGCKGPVWCVDPWDDEHDLCEASFMGNCGHFENLNAVRGFSPQDCTHIPDVDMVFIDGDHSRQGIEADIEFWLPKTRQLLCGHDYTEARTHDEGYPDVKAVVDEVFGAEAVVVPDTAIWVVQ